MRIDVTADHLARGEPNNCSACPVALAILDATGERWDVQEEEAENYRTGDVVLFPPDVGERIRRIDAFCSDPVDPFSFEFEIEEAMVEP